MKTLRRLSVLLAGFVLVTNAAFADIGLIVNVSGRFKSVNGAGVPIVGFVIPDTIETRTDMTVLLRGMGPSLTQFGVPGVMKDPVLTLYQGQDKLASNSDWATNAAELKSVASAIGAFSFTPGYADAALYKSLKSGAYTCTALPASGVDGIVLVEAYTGPTWLTNTLKFANASIRAATGPKDAVFTMGFVVTEGSIPLLIRGVGPSLTQFGVSGAAQDVTMTLFYQYKGNSFALIPNSNGGYVWKLASTLAPGEVTNDDWNNTDDNTRRLIKLQTPNVGAFALDATAKDAAIVITLDQGSYTLQIKSKNPATDYSDIVLGEIYALYRPLPPSIGGSN